MNLPSFEQILSYPVQIKKFIREKPFHSFLIGLYIISFIFIRNLNQVTLSMTYRSVLINFIVTGIVFGISYLLLRSARKAGIFSTILLIGFFTYGFLYDQLEALFYKGSWPFSHIHRFLLISYLLFYTFLLMLLYKSSRQYYRLNYLLNFFILILFLLNLPLALIGGSGKHLQRNNSFLTSIGSMGFDTRHSDSLPDVYYIILDGYASEKTLQRFYSEKHPALYDYLRKKCFYIADSSYANYPSTNPSLSSSLNLNYLDSSSMKEDLIRQNLTCKFFQNEKYRVINVESGYAVSENLKFTDTTFHTWTLNEFENSLFQLTFLRIDDVLGYTNYLRLKNQLSQLPLLLNQKGPKFSFIHIVCPHPPFVVDEQGNKKVRKSIDNMAWEPRDYYLDQLKFISKSIVQFVDTVIANSKKPPIIILQSDHGPWISDKNPENVYEARAQILNAYFVPDSIKNKLYCSITPVNSFRLLLSKLFVCKFPILPDKAVSWAQLRNDVTFKLYSHK